MLFVIKCFHNLSELVGLKVLKHFTFCRFLNLLCCRHNSPVSYFFSISLHLVQKISVIVFSSYQIIHGFMLFELNCKLQFVCCFCFCCNFFRFVFVSRHFKTSLFGSQLNAPRYVCSVSITTYYLYLNIDYLSSLIMSRPLL